MKTLLLILFLICPSAHALGEADDLHVCLAWLTTYEQFHPDDYDTSVLESRLELEMKISKVYNINQIENAMEMTIMDSAADKSDETKRNLRRCTQMAKDFIK